MLVAPAVELYRIARLCFWRNLVGESSSCVGKFCLLCCCGWFCVSRQWTTPGQAPLAAIWGMEGVVGWGSGSCPSAQEQVQVRANDKDGLGLLAQVKVTKNAKNTA